MTEVLSTEGGTIQKVIEMLSTESSLVVMLKGIVIKMSSIHY